jgi:large subunit ribosomal protein L22
MATFTAQLNDYRQSPRKVRLVANMIKGKKLEEALNTLAFVTKDATLPLAKLIRSAVQNAKHNHQISSSENLIIKDIQVNAGVVMKRSMPRARGSAYPIKKRTSHIKVILEGEAPAAEVAKALPKAKKTKKTAVKAAK